MVKQGCWWPMDPAVHLHAGGKPETRPGAGERIPRPEARSWHCLSFWSQTGELGGAGGRSSRRLH